MHAKGQQISKERACICQIPYYIYYHDKEGYVFIIIIFFHNGEYNTMHDVIEEVVFVLQKPTQ